MAKPIEIAFTSDTREVIKGAGDIGEAFEEVSDSLRDLGRDGDRATEDLADATRDAEKAAEDLADRAEDAGDAFRDGGRDGERALGDLESAIQAAQDDAEKLGKDGQDALDKLAASSRKAGKDTGDALDDGFKKGSAGAEEFGEEAGSEAREMASSFDGSVESIADMFQSLAANAFQGFGPAGQAAGLAAAVGLGLALAKLQEISEEQTEAATKAGELGRELYETGGMLDDSELAEKIADIAFELGREDVWWQFGNQASTNVGLVQAALEGVSDEIAKDSFKALAGDLEAASRAQQEMEESVRRDTAALQDHIQYQNEAGIVYDEEGRKLKDSIDAREELADKIEEETGVRRGANDEVAYYTDIMGDATDEVEAQNEALTANVEALDAQAEAAMGADRAELNYHEVLATTTETIKENGQTIDLNTEKGRENRAAVMDRADAARAHIDALIEEGASTADVTAKTQEARQSFIDSAEAAGYSEAQAKELADQYGLIPANVDTRVKAHNVQETKDEIDGVADPRTATVNAELGDTSPVDTYLGSLANKKIPVQFFSPIGRMINP